ncbi:MAG: GxxExxY protein [Lentisphaerae bacterium]|nr:GxxExxY protein [Lentisphaerota bacterium]
MINDQKVMALCDRVRATSMAIHAYLKHGHLEKIYENALAHRLSKQGINVQQQYPLKVFDEDGTILGDYFADLLVEEELIIEIKACQNLADDHIAQILGYLRASRMRHGLLINYGASKLQLKKLVL